MKNISPKIFDWLAFAALVGTIVFIWLQFGTHSPESVAPGENAGARVELQRYMGYEILPVRYLSLPYDITMGANEQVQLLDMGALLLIFVPIVMLLGFSSKPWRQLGVVLACMFLLVISTANGILTGADTLPIRINAESLQLYLQTASFGDAPIGVVVAHVYQLLLPIYGGIHQLLTLVSGDRDAITYPILLLAFFLFFQITKQRIAGKENWLRALSAFIFVYVFFWLALSSGVVWYGLLAIPIITLLIFSSFSKLSEQKGLFEKISLYGFYAIVGSWALFGVVNRISNVSIVALKNDSLAGRRLYDPAFIRYNTGIYSEKQVIDAFYTNLSGALDQINQETNSLVYNVGARFVFFVKNNDKRVFKDYILDFFNQVYAKYGETGQVIPVLKASGFRYILVDFNTPTLDNTPERTLVNRYKTLMNFLVNDPNIELVATNRRLKIGGGTQYGLVGGEVDSPGSYAIFRIK